MRRDWMQSINVKQHTCERKYDSGVDSWCVFNTLWDSWGPWWWWEKLVRDHYRCTHESLSQVWSADTCKIFLYSDWSFCFYLACLPSYMSGCQFKIGCIAILDCTYLSFITIVKSILQIISEVLHLAKGLSRTVLIAKIWINW